MSNGDTETITDKTLNSTKVGGFSALLLAGLSAVVPVVQTLTSNNNVPAGVVIGMEALAAVLACLAAWIYTVDARIRADLAKTRQAAGKGPAVTVGVPFEVKLRGHPRELEKVLAIRFDEADEMEILVAESGGAPTWRKLDQVELA